MVYSYFQKSMKSALVIRKASAMSAHQKFSILSNEVIRRMSNISDKISQTERVDIINKFTRELKSSGVWIYQEKSQRNSGVWPVRPGKEGN